MLAVSRRLKRGSPYEPQGGAEVQVRIEYTPTLLQSMPGNCATFRRLCRVRMSNTGADKSIVRTCIELSYNAARSVLKQRQLRTEHGRPKQRQIVSKALALIETQPGTRSGKPLR